MQRLSVSIVFLCVLIPFLACGGETSPATSNQYRVVKFKMIDLTHRVNTGTFELPRDACFFSFYISAPSNDAAIAALAGTFEMEHDTTELGKRLARKHDSSALGFWWGKILPEKDRNVTGVIPGPTEPHRVRIPLMCESRVKDGADGTKKIRRAVGVGAVEQHGPNKGRFKIQFDADPHEDCSLWCAGMRHLKREGAQPDLYTYASQPRISIR